MTAKKRSGRGKGAGSTSSAAAPTDGEGDSNMGGAAPQQPRAALKLRPGDWAVPVVSASDVHQGKNLVAMLSDAEAASLRAVVAGSAEKICFITPTPLVTTGDGASTEFECKCLNLQDRLLMVKRYATQLGTKGTTPFYLRASQTLHPKCTLQNSTVKAVLQLPRDAVTPAVYSAACANPVGHFAEWLKARDLWSTGVSYAMRPVKRVPERGSAYLEQVVMVKTEKFAALMGSSGADGTFAREFATDETVSQHRVVWVSSEGATLQSVRLQATALNGLDCGLAWNKRGYGVRVLTANYERVGRMLMGNTFEPAGKVYEIANVPLWCAPDDLIRDFQGVLGWVCAFVRPMPAKNGHAKRFLVKAGVEPCKEGVCIGSSFVTIQPAAKPTQAPVITQAFAGRGEQQRRQQEVRATPGRAQPRDGVAAAAERTNSLRAAIGMQPLPKKARI